VTPASKVTISGKDAKLADLKAGDKVTITMTADDSAALTISTAKTEGGGKPKGDKPKGEKPE